LIGFWRSGPHAAIELREDGTFSPLRESPSDGKWTLVEGWRIKLQVGNDSEPRITYRIDRFEPNEMDVVIEETNDKVSFRRLTADEP
jgi:hypothetical protein